VITYRPKSALREMAKAAGLSPGHADGLTKWIDRWGRDVGAFENVKSEGPPVPALVLDLAGQVLDFPRHLGIHSGGMVMADRPLVEFCPIEWARMEDRSVLQWDKDDCAAAGPEPGRLGASVPAPPQRPGARHVSASHARGMPEEDPGRAAVPGAAHADGDRHRRLQSR